MLKVNEERWRVRDGNEERRKGRREEAKGGLKGRRERGEKIGRREGGTEKGHRAGREDRLREDID